MRLLLLIAAVTVGLGLMLAVFRYVPKYIETFMATVASSRNA